MLEISKDEKKKSSKKKDVAEETSGKRKVVLNELKSSIFVTKTRNFNNMDPFYSLEGNDHGLRFIDSRINIEFNLSIFIY